MQSKGLQRKRSSPDGVGTPKPAESQGFSLARRVKSFSHMGVCAVSLYIFAVAALRLTSNAVQSDIMVSTNFAIIGMSRDVKSQVVVCTYTIVPHLAAANEPKRVSRPAAALGHQREQKLAVGHVAIAVQQLIRQPAVYSLVPQLPCPAHQVPQLPWPP